MRHAVLGAGGVGAFLGAALARTGREVLREESLERYDGVVPTLAEACAARADRADDDVARLPIGGVVADPARDREAGRPTEIDAIGGSILRAAARHGLEIPATQELVGGIRAGEPE